VHPQTHSVTPTKCSSQFTRSRPPSASPHTLHHGLPVHLQTESITASKCISQFTRSRPPSASPNYVDHGLQVYCLGATVGVRRFRGNRSGLSDALYILGRPRGRQIDSISFSSDLVIQRKYTLYLSQRMVSFALCEISWIGAIAWILMHCNPDATVYTINPFRCMVTVGHNARVFVANRRATEREGLAKRESDCNKQLETWYWHRAQSNPPPGYLWWLWRSVSTLKQPVRPDGNVFFWWTMLLSRRKSIYTLKRLLVQCEWYTMQNRLIAYSRYTHGKMSVNGASTIIGHVSMVIVKWFHLYLA
jgi:hypothetical protein